MSVLGALAITAGISALNGIMNYAGSKASTDMSVDAQKELFDYQWNKAQSPHAQIQNLTAEGINPTAVFGSSPNVVGGSMPSVSVPPIQYSTGVDNIRSLTGAMSDLAQAKKAGADTSKVEKEIEGQVLSNESQQLQNRITLAFGMERAGLELANAYQGVLLAEKENDIKAKDKALKDWEIAKEKALSEATEANRDILRKELDNKDKEIELRNKESEARAESSRASAEASRASASLSYAQKKTEDTLREWRKSLTKNQAAQLYHQIKNIDMSTEEKAIDALRKLTGLSDAPWTQVYNDIKKVTGVVKPDDVLEYLEYHGFKLPSN